VRVAVRAAAFLGIALFIGCTAFGADDPPAVTKTQKDAGKPTDAGASDAAYAEVPPPSDAGVSTSPDAGLIPADAFQPVAAYDRFDSWERGDGPLNGAFKWVAVGDPNDGNPVNITVKACAQDQSCSPTKAIEIDSVPINDPGGGGGAFLQTTLSSSTRVLRFDFALDIRTPQVISRSQLVTFQLANDRYLILEVIREDDKGTSGLYVSDQFKDTNGSFSTDSVRLGNTPQSWTRYQLYINLDLKVFAVAQTNEIYATAKTLRPEVITTFQMARIGISYQGPNSDFNLGFDDVGVTETPTPPK
jgi:hypothetical protein